MKILWAWVELGNQRLAEPFLLRLGRIDGGDLPGALCRSQAERLTVIFESTLAHTYEGADRLPSQTLWGIKGKGLTVGVLRPCPSASAAARRA